MSNSVFCSNNMTITKHKISKLEKDIISLQSWCRAWKIYAKIAWKEKRKLEKLLKIEQMRASSYKWELDKIKLVKFSRSHLI